MYEFVKKGAFMLLVVSLAMGMASCGDDDPDYSDVTATSGGGCDA